MPIKIIPYANQNVTFKKNIDNNMSFAFKNAIFKRADKDIYAVIQ